MTAWPARRRLQRIGARLLFWAVVALILVYTVFPFYWAVVSSLKTGQALFGTALVPADPSGANYVSVFREQPFLTNILSVTAAYALGRIRFRGRGLLLATILGVSMFPQVAVLSGLFELVRWLGLYNTLPALILANLITTLPFSVWVLTTFMREMPRELEEAALVDGATPLQTVVKVFLPLLGPAMATTGLLAFIAAWNEFLFALTLTLSNDVRTVPVAIALISGATQFDIPWGNIMAASVVVTVPLVVLVLIFQRRIVSGLTAGAVKG
jgi:trehalose/maltose transport system permease protein